MSTITLESGTSATGKLIPDPLTPDPCFSERPISLSRLYVVAFCRMGRESPARSTRHWNPMNRTFRSHLPRAAAIARAAAGQRLYADGTADRHRHHSDSDAHGHSHHRQHEEERQRDLGNQLRADRSTKAEMQYESTYPGQRLCLHAGGFGRRPELRAALADRRADASAGSGLGFKSGYIFTIELHQGHRSTARTATPATRLRPCPRRWARPATAASAATSTAPSSSTRPAAPTAPRPCNERFATLRAAAGVLAAALLSSCLYAQERSPSAQDLARLRASTAITTSCTRFEPALPRLTKAWA